MSQVLEVEIEESASPTPVVVDVDDIPWLTTDEPEAAAPKTRFCANPECGKEFEPRQSHFEFCPDCWKKGVKHCSDCGAIFTPAERHYKKCPACFSKKVCVTCNESFVPTNPRFTRCPTCQEKWQAEQEAVRQAEVAKEQQHCSKGKKTAAGVHTGLLRWLENDVPEAAALDDAVMAIIADLEQVAVRLWDSSIELWWTNPVRSLELAWCAVHNLNCAKIICLAQEFYWMAGIVRNRIREATHTDPLPETHATRDLDAMLVFVDRVSKIEGIGDPKRDIETLLKHLGTVDRMSRAPISALLQPVPETVAEVPADTGEGAIIEGNTQLPPETAPTPEPEVVEMPPVVEMPAKEVEPDEQIASQVETGPEPKKPRGKKGRGEKGNPDSNGHKTTVVTADGKPALDTTLIRKLQHMTLAELTECFEKDEAFLNRLAPWVEDGSIRMPAGAKAGKDDKLILSPELLAAA